MLYGIFKKKENETFLFFLAGNGLTLLNAWIFPVWVICWGCTLSPVVTQKKKEKLAQCT